MSDRSDGNGHSLILAFDTDDSEFARGFEVGRLYGALCVDDKLLDGEMIHASNAEMVMRMIDEFDVEIRTEFTDDPTWMVLRVAA